MVWWLLTPKNDPDDPFRNRRNIAYICVFYALIFSGFTLYGALNQVLDAAEITALLAFPNALCAWVAKIYFDACKVSTDGR